MTEMAYVAIHSCGRIVAGTVDVPEHRRITGRDVAGWIRRGDTIKHISLDKAKAQDWCDCWRKAAKAKP